MNTLAERFAQAKVEALGEGKAEKQAGAKVDTLAEKLRKWQVNYCAWCRLTRNGDTRLQACRGRRLTSWPNIRRGEDLDFILHNN